MNNKIDPLINKWLELSNLAVTLERCGQYDSAIEQQEKALILAKETGNPLCIGRSLGNLGCAYHKKHNDDKAIDLLLEAYQISGSILDMRGLANWEVRLLAIAEAIWASANCHYLSSRFEAAIEDYRSALQIYQAVKSKNEAECIFKLGKCHKNLGYFKEASEYFGEYEKWAIENDCPEEEAWGLNAQGDLHIQLKKYGQSLVYLEKALGIMKRRCCDKGVCSVSGNIGVCHLFLARYDLAEDFFQSALKIAAENEYKDEMQKWTGNLGNIRYKKGELEKALKYYTEAFRIATEIRNEIDSYTWETQIKAINKNLGARDKGHNLSQETILDFFEPSGNWETIQNDFNVLSGVASSVSPIRLTDKVPDINDRVSIKAWLTMIHEWVHFMQFSSTTWGLLISMNRMAMMRALLQFCQKLDANLKNGPHCCKLHLPLYDAFFQGLYPDSCCKDISELLFEWGDRSFKIAAHLGYSPDEEGVLSGKS